MSSLEGETPPLVQQSSGEQSKRPYEHWLQHFKDRLEVAFRELIFLLLEEGLGLLVAIDDSWISCTKLEIHTRPKRANIAVKISRNGSVSVASSDKMLTRNDKGPGPEEIDDARRCTRFKRLRLSKSRRRR